MVDRALDNGIKRPTYHSRIARGWSPERAATEATHVYKGEYAVYKNDEIIAMGTAEECAEELGVSAAYIKWMTSPSGKKRLAEKLNPEMATTAAKLDDAE